jgi:hypothetical protein
MNEPIEPSAKVLFRVPNDDGTAEVETLWATPLGGDKYKLGNSPFYAYSVSWQDIVYAPFSAEDGLPTFERVLSKSGNRTIRVAFESPAETGNESDQVMKGLVALGCDYEGASTRYISVNIPPSVKLEIVRQYLIQCKATWEHADPSYGELFPDQT